MKRFSWRAVAVVIVLGPAGAMAPLDAQSATVSVPQENFRAAPRGTVVAELLEGTPLSPGEARDRWREATLEAWIWSASVEPVSRDGHDLRVGAGGENLRDAPNGRRLGRALPGMLLDRIEVRGDWIRVRRTGWIWEPSIRVTEADTAADPAAGIDVVVTLDADRAVVAVPAGDTVARVRSGATVEVLAREGAWARVRLEGWIPVADLAGRDTATSAVLHGLTRDTIQADPARFRGRVVEWNVQFIALQEAERFRTDFREGEAFILARGPGEDPGFVYIAVPPEQVGSVRQLTPLQRLRVVGRIRTARSALTGAPVLELLRITGR